MLPWPERHWDIVPSAEPFVRTVKFPCVYRGTRLLATATARSDQIDLEPLAGVRLEVPLEVWKRLAPYLTALALSLPED